MNFLAKELFCLKSLMNLKKNLEEKLVSTQFWSGVCIFFRTMIRFSVIMKCRQTLWNSLKAEVLEILSINQTADSFVNATHQLSRNAKNNWMGICDTGSTLSFEATGRKQVEHIPSVWLITPRICLFWKEFRTFSVVVETRVKWNAHHIMNCFIRAAVDAGL